MLLKKSWLLVFLLSCSRVVEFENCNAKREEKIVSDDISKLATKIEKEKNVLEELKRVIGDVQHEVFDMELDLINFYYESFYDSFEMVKGDDEKLRDFVKYVPKELFFEERKRINEIVLVDQSLKTKGQDILNKILVVITKIDNVK